MNGSRSALYRIIRMALLGGVLMFGVVAWIVSSNETFEPAPAELRRRLQLLFAILALAAAVAIAFVRSAQEKAPALEQRATLAIVGWALGEGVALFGGVIFLLTARPLIYLAGLLLLIAALVVVPVPEES